MAIQYSDTVPGNTANGDGVFIPTDNISGIEVGEFTIGTTNTKDSKLLFGILSSIVANLPGDALGLSAIKGNISGISASIFSQQFTFSFQLRTNLGTKGATVLPVATGGTYQDVGKVSLLDIFPDAVKVTSGGTLSGEGVVLLSADLDDYFAPSHGGLTIGASSDNRDYLVGLVNYLYNTLAIRSAGNASALISKNKSDGIVTLSAAAYAETNPTMGLTAANLLNSVFTQTTQTFTIQSVLNDVTQTYEVRVVTA